MKATTTTISNTPMLQEALSQCEPGENVRIVIEGKLSSKDGKSISVEATSVSKEYLESKEPESAEEAEPQDDNPIAYILSQKSKRKR